MNDTFVTQESFVSFVSFAFWLPLRSVPLERAKVLLTGAQMCVLTSSPTRAPIHPGDIEAFYIQGDHSKSPRPLRVSTGTKARVAVNMVSRG